MNKVKAAFAAIILVAGGAVSAAAADMPMAPAYVPFGPEAPRTEHARLVCNGFGRCFRVGPPPVFYGPRIFYPAPRVYAPPIYRGPDYDVGRSYPERRFDAPSYDYRRSEEYRRSYGERRNDAPADEYRRPREYRQSERDSRREEWSPDYRGPEGGDERY